MNLPHYGLVWSVINIVRGQCDLHAFSARLNASPTWKGIVDILPFLKNRMGSVVANGLDTLFWRRVWVGTQPLLDLTIRPVPVEKHSATVADYWAQDVRWRWDLFVDHLPSSILEQISSFELVSDDAIRDNLFWRGDISGTFCIKSAIRIIQGT